MKKIGILYICTGEYDKFWNDFFSHSQKYFLNDCELHYFIFTDSNELLSNKNNNIHAIYQEKMEWPYPTLLRYKIFTDNKISYQLFLEGIETEFAWQQLIFNFHSSKIVVNEKEINEELNQIITKKKQAEEYNLAEIEVLLENNDNDKKKIEEIKNQINEIGFKDTAIK